MFENIHFAETIGRALIRFREGCADVWGKKELQKEGQRERPMDFPLYLTTRPFSSTGSDGSKSPVCLPG